MWMQLLIARFRPGLSAKVRLREEYHAATGREALHGSDTAASFSTWLAGSSQDGWPRLLDRSETTSNSPFMARGGNAANCTVSHPVRVGLVMERRPYLRRFAAFSAERRTPRLGLTAACRHS
jgi:hypothetical protein